MLIILTTHPIQYQVPIWQALGDDGQVPFEVWYLTDHAVRASADREFGQSFAWDIGRDTLEGYRHRFLNVNPDWTLRLGEFFGLRLAESVGLLFREAGARVLWVQGWQNLAYWQAVWQGKQAGLDVWLRGESNDLASVPAWKRPLKRILLHQLFERVDRFLCVGSANRRLYQSMHVSEAKLDWAPYCVDNNRFAVQADEFRPRRAELRHAWGIADDALCVLFCGKFIPKKRPLDLVTSAVRLNALFQRPISALQIAGHAPITHVHLLFVGSGELGPRLRSATQVVFDAEYGTKLLDSAKPKASFTGFLNQTEISQAYVAAECLALPSDAGETWGLVVNEAMASGLPCASSAACGNTEDLVAPLAPEAQFPLGDTDAMAEAILSASHLSPGLVRSHIGSFDLQVTVEAVVSAYKSHYAPV